MHEVLLQKKKVKSLYRKRLKFGRGRVSRHARLRN